MKKKKRSEIFSYNPEVKLTIDDISEIYSLLKSINEKSSIEVNSYELEDISEINQIKPPFEEIIMWLPEKTFILFGEDRITLNLEDNADVVLLGLKSKFDTILKNRANPKKQSIIDHNEQKTPQVPFINQGTVVLGDNNITGSNISGITNVGDGAKVENSINDNKKQNFNAIRDNFKTKTKPKPQKPNDLALEIIDYAKLAIVAMVCIYMVYIIATNFVGQLPAQIGSIILGIALLFIFATSSSFRDIIMNLGKNQKKE